MGFVLQGGKVFADGELTEKDIAVEGGKITFNGAKNPRKIDCSGMLILPGAIDSHVHFRAPGGESREDWLTGSRAAVSGGVTTVLDMPNNNPAAKTLHLLREKRRTAEKLSLCNFGFFLGAANDNAREIMKLEKGAVKLYYGSSTGSLLTNEERMVKAIFEICRKKNLLVAVHAESESIMNENMKRFRDHDNPNPKIHSEIRSMECETEAVKELLGIQRKTGNRLHFCHISTAEAAGIITEAKEGNSNITFEVCPHHLFLSEADYKRLGNFAKVNPPLRTKKDCRTLWNFVKGGRVDIIATDHAPHTLEEKKRDYWHAPSGIPSVENMLPLLLNECSKGEIPPEKIAQLVCENPAKIFGMKSKGHIKDGFDADLVVVDMQAERTIQNEKQYTKCRWSPYDGWRLKGWPVMAIVNGNIVFERGKFNEADKGCMVF